jgi:hypothetical protein
MYDIVDRATKKVSYTPSVGYVTAPGIYDADYFSVASFTVTGLQSNIYWKALRFSCYLKKYTVMIFKRMSKLKKRKENGYARTQYRSC